MKKILVILGPTATGKSAVAIKLAKKYNGEIISADSRQVYKGLNIGTGKVTRKEMGQIVHHLLDVEIPQKQFSVSDFKKLATVKIELIERKGKLPIIVGGTGFYIDAITGATNFPDIPVNIRLRKKLNKRSVLSLFNELKKKDPQRAKTIDSKNKVRLIRALEIISVLGKVPKQKLKTNKNFIYVGLDLPKKELDLKILKRLMYRLTHRMIGEAKNLHKQGLSFKRMEELGLEYKYLAKYLKKEISKKELVDELFKEIKRYSKRQRTWFKRNKQIKWFKPSEYKDIEKYVRMAREGL